MKDIFVMPLQGVGMRKEMPSRRHFEFHPLTKSQSLDRFFACPGVLSPGRRDS